MSKSTPKESRTVMAARGLKKHFKQGDTVIRVLDGVDLDILAGESVAIVGQSGAGKSTLLHVLGGLDRPSEGTVDILGQNLARLSNAARGRQRGAHMGFVYQFHHLLPEFTALENVAMPLLIGGQKSSVAAEQARNMLGRVGLAERVTHKPGELSGGERQRAAIARALINSPAVVLADEPTGNLDKKTAAAVFDMILQLQDQLDTALVIVTHDPALAERMDRVLVLDEGRLRPPD